MCAWVGFSFVRLLIFWVFCSRTLCEQVLKRARELESIVLLLQAECVCE